MRDPDLQVSRWLLEESLSTPDLCTEFTGSVRWAFVLAFAALRRRMGFEQAIEWTLNKAGDTDTNAAIVGAMMGALWGWSLIPDWMSTPVLAFDPTTCEVGRRRPALYAPSSLAHLTGKSRAMVVARVAYDGWDC